MAVVINEFEVVSEPAAQQRRGGSDAPAEQPPKHHAEPHVIAPALHALSAQSLRAWAH